MIRKAKLVGDNPIKNQPVHRSLMSIDIETTGLEWCHEILGVALAWKGKNEEDTAPVYSCYLSMQDRGQLSLFAGRYEQIDNTAEFLQSFCNEHLMVGHHLPFDYRMLYKEFNLNPIERSLDTKHLGRSLAAHTSLSLSALCKEYIPDKVDQEWLQAKKRRKTLERQDLETQAVYARADAVLTLELVEELLGQAPPHMYKNLSWDNRFSNLVMKMVKHGVPVNRPWLLERKDAFLQQIIEIEQELRSQGLKSVTDDAVRGFLFGTLDLPVIKETSTGKPSADIDVLEKYAHVPQVTLILEHRQLKKAIGSWIDDLLMMSEQDGNAHSILSPFGTASYRMSSENINLQAVPMKERGRAFGSFHGAFAAHDSDRMLYALDLKQAEVRIATMLAHESNLAEVLISGEDPYVNMSKRIWDTPDRRTDAKRATLSGIYEIGKFSFSVRYKVSEEEADTILKAFRSRFPAIKKASRHWDNFVQRNGYISTFTGRRRHFGEWEETWKGFNQLVQTTVAEIMQSAMLKIDDALGDAAPLVLQIHDSLVLDLPADPAKRQPILDEAINILETQSLSEEVFNQVTPRVPLPVDTERWQ